MRSFKIYSLSKLISNFQTCNIVLLTIVTMSWYCTLFIYFLIFILFLNFTILYFKFQGLIYFMPNFLFGISEGEVQLSAF